MNGTFYYLAAYTAAAAAGFSEADGMEFARAARYAQDCIEARIQPQSMAAGPAERGFWAALHYLPGDPRKASADVNPAFAETAGRQFLLELPLVCGPDGELAREVVERMRRQWNSEYACTPMWQSIGISLHALGSACLHQGFAGIPSERVNAAAGIARAGRISEETLREILPQAAQVPLAELLELEPYVPQPRPESFLGCGQLGELMDGPSQMFVYQSPWRTVPAVSVLNPVRFARAYLAMKNALIYVRTGDQVPDQPLSCPELTGLACFFNTVSGDQDLEELWRQHFAWCRGPSEDYEAPAYDTDRNYVNSFDAQVLAYRDFVRSSCPNLCLWTDSVSAAQRQAAPETGG